MQNTTFVSTYFGFNCQYLLDANCLTWTAIVNNFIGSNLFQTKRSVRVEICGWRRCWWKCWFKHSLCHRGGGWLCILWIAGGRIYESKILRTSAFLHFTVTSSKLLHFALTLQLQHLPIFYIWHQLCRCEIPSFRRLWWYFQISNVWPFEGYLWKFHDLTLLAVIGDSERWRFEEIKKKQEK